MRKYLSLISYHQLKKDLFTNGCKTQLTYYEQLFTNNAIKDCFDIFFLNIKLAISL